MASERRQDDPRIKEIHETVQKIEKILIGEKGDNGVCGRLGIVEARRDSTQEELSEHKSNHWQYMGLLIGIAGVAIALLEFLRK